MLGNTLCVVGGSGQSQAQLKLNHKTHETHVATVNDTCGQSKVDPPMLKALSNLLQLYLIQNSGNIKALATALRFGTCTLQGDALSESACAWERMFYLFCFGSQCVLVCNMHASRNLCLSNTFDMLSHHQLLFTRLGLIFARLCSMWLPI